MTYKRAAEFGWDWITLPKVEGTSSRQAHVALPEGTVERQLGKEGFYGPATHMYHTHLPTEFSKFEGPLHGRAWDIGNYGKVDKSPWDALECISNEHCKIRFWNTKGAMDHLVRNADGDDLLFIHEGEGDLFCDYGHLEFREGDYIVMPRGTMWRTEPKDALKMLLIEATNESFRLPDKGLMGTNTVFDPAMFEAPSIDDAFKAQQGETSWQLKIKRNGQISTATYAFNPLDAVGWHGSLSPVRLNWRDLRPIMSHRMHMPISAHTTFVADRFVVCTFVPRPLIESDPELVRVPAFHSNDEMDEVAFYHAGSFIHRDDVGGAMLTHLPAGYIHGPAPEMMKHASAKTGIETGAWIDGVAISIDTRDGIFAKDIPDKLERMDWHLAWQATPAKAAE